MVVVVGCTIRGAAYVWEWRERVAQVIRGDQVLWRVTTQVSRSVREGPRDAMGWVASSSRVGWDQGLSRSVWQIKGGRLWYDRVSGSAERLVVADGIGMVSELFVEVGRVRGVFVEFVHGGRSSWFCITPRSGVMACK